MVKFVWLFLAIHTHAVPLPANHHWEPHLPFAGPILTMWRLLTHSWSIQGPRRILCGLTVEIRRKQANKYCAVKLVEDHVIWNPWGLLTDKSGTGMCGSKDPHYGIFSVLKILLAPPNHKFLEILTSKASKLAKSLVPKPQIGKQFSSHGYISLRNLVHKGPKFSTGPFTCPSVQPTPILIWKLSASLPPPSPSIWTQKMADSYERYKEEMRQMRGRRFYIIERWGRHVFEGGSSVERNIMTRRWKWNLYYREMKRHNLLRREIWVKKYE